MQTKTQQKPSETAAGNAPGFPLFFQSPVPLDIKRHEKAGITPRPDLSFAENTNSIPLNVAEFIEAGKQYPIVFTQGANTLPVAVVGLEKQNYFIDQASKWKQGAYIPAYVRKYPFVFMEIPERKQFVLCIDEGAKQYKEKGGKDTTGFYEGGKPSEMTRNALEFCTAFHNHHQITRQFVEVLKKHDLLTSMQSTAKLFNGREIQLGGFLAIDEKKVAALSDDTVLELRKKGWLPFIYYALMSATNWKQLVNLAAQQEGTQAEED